MEKREAVERLRSGDIGGLEALVRGHQIRALRAAYLITRDRASTEDGWLRALRSEGYAARIRGRSEALQQTLFPYLEACRHINVLEGANKNLVRPPLV